MQSMQKTSVLLDQLLGRQRERAAHDEKPAQTHFEEIAQYGFGPEVMKRLKICEGCGEQAHGQTTHCSSCGRALPEKTLYELYRMGHRLCPCCGTVIPADGDFCPHCGRPYPREADAG